MSVIKCSTRQQVLALVKELQTFTHTQYIQAKKHAKYKSYLNDGKLCPAMKFAFKLIYEYNIHT